MQDMVDGKTPKEVWKRLYVLMEIGPLAGFKNCDLDATLSSQIPLSSIE